MKKFLLMALSMVTVAVVAIVGTVAYLTWEDSDVNVMTVGNVQIEQIEQERDANGNLVDFTQGKPVLPAVYEGASIPWAAEDEWPVPGNAAWKVVEDNENVVDKFVSVKNTGKSDAFVRTIIAFEGGKDEIGEPYMHLVHNDSAGTWDFEWAVDANNEDITIEIDGSVYYIGVYTYTKVLEPGATTVPSVKQVYLDKTATNEICAAYGDTFEILALSQAVQADGFDSAADALTAGFGEINEDNIVKWFAGMEIPAYVSTMADLEAALANGGEVNLTADIAIPEGEQILVPEGSTATLNLNGYTITSPSMGYGIRNEGNVTITNGTIEGQFGAIGNYKNAVCVVENATLISKGYPESSSHAIYTSGNSSLTLTNVTVKHEGAGADGSILYAAGNSTVVINSGDFTWSGSAYTLAAAGTSTVTINGGTFQNDNFFKWGGTITDNR